MALSLTTSSPAHTLAATMSDPVVDALRLGKAMEREAIVAWLEDAKRGDLSGRYLASFIERGEHLRGDDE